MKNRIITLAMTAAIMGYGITAQAQSAEDNKNAEFLTVGVGGTFGKPKILNHLENLAIPQVTINYKLSTTERVTTREKGSGQTAGAKVTAYLETTDGQLTTADFQEVSNYFYDYFQKKLKANGIDTIAWSTITAADFYKSSDEKKADEDQEKKGGQVWVTNNARNGNTIYGGKIGFVFGKGMRAVKFAKELDAPTGYFYLTVDFADVTVGLDIKSGTHEGYYAVTRTINYKYDAAVRPNMKITTNELGMSMLENGKGVVENLTLNEEIESKAKFHTAVNEDQSRMKNNPFRFAKEMKPVVVETTREQYKAAAKKALEKYADAFVAKVKIMKKD
ncbi:MAG: hypothetical protein JWQ38_51 [Flavipsychrobacter sp.]|nr:hypothetical protein [Flavipsychrobacter sp.]